MKTPRFPHRVLTVLALAAIPLFSGCTQQSARSAPAYAVTSSTAPAVVTQVVPVAAAPAEQPAPASVVAPVAPTTPPLLVGNDDAPLEMAEPVLPPNLRISQPLGEIIRLAQSGVEETVILTYVTNSPAIFTLGAEEIVYLNDLGISSSVMTAMMQRDQVLRTAWAEAANPPDTTSNVETVAAAPTYVNSPQPVAAPQVQPVYVSNDYFYDSLSPYGTWVEVDGYGRVWRPTVAITSPSWQPYRDRGRWVHTDAGWYWMSDYSWGSVAFHYGRWFSHPRYGWCWWPDTVWAPSWVTWRYHDDYAGWAPLPPHSYYRSGAGFVYHGRSVEISFDFGLHVGAYSFVPWGRFCDPRPYHHYLPRPRSVAIYNQTTVINNVVIGNNNTVINRGIDKDRVRERSRTEVRTVSIREERPRGAIPRSARFERDGRTLVVNRPAVAPASVAGSPRAAAEKGTPRIVPSRGTESRVENSARPIGTRSAGGRTDRNGSNPAREIESRTAVHPAAPATISSPAPTVVTTPRPVAKPVIPTPQSTSPTTIRTESRTRSSPTTVVRTPETRPTPAPTPVRNPTPIFSKPVVVETPAYTPTRTIAPIPQPRPQAPAAAPSYRTTPARSQYNPAINNAPQVQSPQSVPSAPSYNRPSVEPQRVERATRNDVIDRARSQERSSAPTYVAPAPRITPAPMPTPAPIQRPAYTPPPARVEARPAPSRSEVSRPAPPPAPSPAPTPKSAPEEGRPGRNR